MEAQSQHEWYLSDHCGFNPQQFVFYFNFSLPLKRIEDASPGLIVDI